MDNAKVSKSDIVQELIIKKEEKKTMKTVTEVFFHFLLSLQRMRVFCLYVRVIEVLIIV